MGKPYDEICDNLAVKMIYEPYALYQLEKLVFKNVEWLQSILFFLHHLFESPLSAWEKYTRNFTMRHVMRQQLG